ncbi:calpain-8 isoform X2 [Heterocephalus glaber]|uniref:Calpain-8 isoform X2 n=1 Tax=Heterocephalus glaber TaxID=10181 RepID=A0AAX6RZU2_HETGA|nr:calpain-8 isoform X2 [Heterocephalus glaber]
MAAQAAGVRRQRAAAEGLGSHQNVVKYMGQDFEALRRQCLDSGVLFKDPEFPACPSALGYKDLGPGSPQTQGVVWRRPTELCPSPQFIVGGATRTDVCQGDLGDCWLLAAIASLTLNEKLLSRVVPGDQSFQENYAGIFRFQFWQYGEWVEVVVDDRLPTKDGELLFLHSAEGTEFWSALLEKAYAKLNGSYEALAGGSTVEGFEDFTGGILEFYDLRKPPANLYRLIQKALRAGSLLGCSIDVSSAAEAEAVTRQKLVKSHAYSVTGVEEVDVGGRPEQLIRLRNPWGEVEWTGAWSDDAPEWSRIDPRRRQELDNKAEDGEFWMSFPDFLVQFSRLEICNLSPDSLSSEEAHKWSLVLFQGRWARGATAGGCQNYPATYWTNPQFKIHLDEADEDQEEGVGEPCCTVLLGLMQKDRRRRRRLGQGLLSIGFAVYQLAGHTDAHLGRDFFRGHQPAACSDTHISLREVWGRVRLPPGEYLLVPSTFEPFKDSDFCLRVFSEKKARGLEIEDVVAGNPCELRPAEVEHGHQELCSLCEELSGKGSEIGADKLKQVLDGVFSRRTDIKFDGFSIHTCREVISLLDSSGTGTLGPTELRALCLKVRKYLEIYQEMDPSHLGTVDAHEMRTALRRAGFSVSTQVQHTIATRYAGRTLCLDFDGFVACMVRLESLFQLFRVLDRNRTGVIQLSLAEVSGWRLESVHDTALFSTPHFRGAPAREAAGG